jgi:DNA mismatch repair protein MutS
MFATHFHEITDYSEINELTNLVFRHLSVVYDRENDCLIYDRKLKDGPGNRTYGLEVCSSLMMPQIFLDRAFEIRNKYFPEMSGVLSSDKTKYNAKKIKTTLCEMCNKNISEEIHHLSEQQLANDDGFIGTFHKNHPANLLSVCEKCHDSIHGNNTKELKSMTKKKTTKGSIYHLHE